jgi:hypothetical protein
VKYLLKDINSIENSARQKLKQVGIENTDQLLERTAFPDQRVALAEHVGIPGDMLLLWSSIADLVRVKGVGLKLAQLLPLTNQIRNVQELAKSDPEAVRGLLKEANDRYQILGRLPTEREIRECIEEAQELRPRLIIKTIEPLDFRAEVEKLDRRYESLWEARNRSWRDFDITVFSLFFLLVVGLFFIYEFDSWPTRSKALSTLMYQAEFSWLLFNVLWVMSAVILAVTLIIISKRLGEWGFQFLKSYIRFRLFDRPLFQRCFLHMEKSVRADTLLAASERVIRLFTIFVIGVIILVLMINEVDLFLITLTAGIILTLTILYPELRHVWNVHKQRTEFGPATLQRYLMFRLSHVIWLLLLAWIALQLLVPATISIHQHIVGEWLVPFFSARLGEIKQEAIGLSPISAPDEELRILFLAKYEPSRIEPFLEIAMLQYEDILHLPHGEFISQIGIIVVWLFILVTLVSLVVPLALLGKGKFGLIFILVVILSEGVETALNKFIPSAFSLPAGSFVALVLTLTLILSNTILFDWLYQESTGSYRQCLSCGEEIKKTDQFCSCCGTPQPALDSAVHY